MPPSSERARRFLFLGDKNEVNLNGISKKSEGVVFLYHLTPLLRNYRSFGLSPIFPYGNTGEKVELLLCFIAFR